MEYYGLNQLREMFLDYYATQNGHLRLNSFSLIPRNDKSLLIINSGMAPLKPYFTGQETPPRKRVTTCQKCIRTPDIENVGKDDRHGTFFEMLGNFSFGDYFKKEAIHWAWTFLTEYVHIPKELLYATVYLDDDEAYEIWKAQDGMTEDHISRMGKEDNFWEIGTGPCGPCSEIYVDRGEKYGCGKPTCAPGCDCDRYVEVWNLVFTQFDRQEDGSYDRLEHPNIDTGMGLERLAMVVQEVDNIFEVDTIKFVRDYICRLAGVDYGSEVKKDISVRVITDHVRSTVFMLSDGIIPSNEGRGYVLRRLMRRAMRHGKLLGIEKPFLSETAEKVIESSSEAYPELLENKELIMKMIDVEENRFNEKINQGEELLMGIIRDLKESGGTEITGQDAFRLYDTFGFPLDLTMEIAGEEEVGVDTEGFDKAMQLQKETSKKAHEAEGIEGWKDEISEIVSGMKATEFIGYDSLESEAKVVCLINGNQSVDEVSSGEECLVITDKTPFYGEMGGEVGDKGMIASDKCLGEVTDTIRSGDKFAHRVKLTSGTLALADTVKLTVDADNRMDISRNHTATHLLHKALKLVLGNHVNQAGSEVTPDKLRFDFSHFEKMSADQIASAEKIVNEQILKCLPVEVINTDLKTAKEMGATALFGEKYGNEVRIIKAGEFSMELCGGCHLKNTGFAGLFKIVSETGVAAGVRRIEALTGRKAYEYVLSLKDDLEEAAAAAKVPTSQLTARINEITESNEKLAKELKAKQNADNAEKAKDMLSSAFSVSGIEYIVNDIGEASANDLREVSDRLRDKMDSGVVFLLGHNDGKGLMLCAATDKAVKSGFKCGDFIKKVASFIGSGGGGRPDMAQAGFKDEKLAGQCMDYAVRLIKEGL